MKTQVCWPQKNCWPNIAKPLPASFNNMLNNKITILSTGSLPEELVAQARQQGITLHIQPFISISTIQTTEVQQEVEQALLQSATVVFTSANAVEAVAEYMGVAEPEWNIYCT